MDRLEQVIDRLEAALVRQTAENARLRKIEAAALAALADLDALIGDPHPVADERRRQGSIG